MKEEIILTRTELINLKPGSFFRSNGYVEWITNITPDIPSLSNVYTLSETPEGILFGIYERGTRDNLDRLYSITKHLCPKKLIIRFKDQIKAYEQLGAGI